MAAKKEIRREGLGQDYLCQLSSLSLRNIKKCQMFSKKTKRFGFITLLLCEKNRCTVLGNIIDIIKMIGACKRVIAREGCI